LSEYRLDKRQREEISSDELAMRILSLLQRNHKTKMTGSGPYISYYPFQLSSLLNFEFFSREEEMLSGIEPSFRQKFAEAVQILANNGLIVADHSQNNTDFQVPSSKGLSTDTSSTVIGVTDAGAFIKAIEKQAGDLDSVARNYLSESYRAAEAKLWLSSVFMLGAASERLIYVLADHIDQLLADPIATASLSNATKIRQRKEWIVDHLSALRRKFPANKQAFIDVEDKFDSLYNTYRYQRNEAGHPRDVVLSVDPKQIKAMLFSFGLYAQAVNSILIIPK
jgi:hypothetical protein